jgi:putative ABC transport system permease protein
MYQLGRDLEVTVARVAAIEVDGGIAAIDAVWKRLAPNAAISRRFLDEIFESAFRYWLLVNQLFGLLALMAFSICIAGLFGMATYVAGRRRHEIGVRKTLGATTRQMIALLLVGFGKPVLVANLVAWPFAYLAARGYLNQFSQSIELTPLPFLLSLGITLAIAGVAVVGQTLRAARATPAQVLRHE